MLWFLKRKENPGVTWLIALSLIVTIISIGGCGYTLRHRLKDSLAQAEKGLYVPVFVNITDEVGAERIFTNALIRELESRGEILIRSREHSSLELRGEIKSIGYNPTAHTAPGFQGLQGYRRMPSEIGVFITLNLQLIDLQSQNILWQKDFSGFRRISTSVTRTYDYQVPSTFGLLTQSLVESSYADIAGDIMRDVYDNMVEIF